MTLDPNDPRHGTVNGYVNQRCRCDECKSAYSAYQRRRRAVTRRRGLPPGDPAHGTTNGYREFGCRCDACHLAARHEYFRKKAAA